MGKRRTIRTILAILAIITFIAGFVFMYLKPKLELNKNDFAYKLTNEQQTINVYNIMWACDCAQWGITGELIPVDSLEEYSIFIEATSKDDRYELANLSDNCWPVKMKLTGQFYLDEGISRDYDLMFEKPDKARVFRYDQFEILETQCQTES